MSKIKGFSADDFKRSLQSGAGALPSLKSQAPAIETEIIPPTREPVSLDDYVEAITTLFHEAGQRFIAIGEHLLRAKAALGHGEFEAMINGRLPFAPRAAQMMMAAYRAVRDNLLPADVTPTSYTVLYEITTLTQDERRRALDEGIIHKDARRAEIRAFKALSRQPVLPTPSNADHAIKRETLKRLLAERARLEEQIAALQAEVGADMDEDALA